MSRAATATRSRRAPEPASPLQTEEQAPRPVGRVLSGRQFWDLMERWRVPDAAALELIEYPGKLGRDGKRPRFRFTTRQQRLTGYLHEIDAALEAAGRDPAWLRRKIATPPFGRRSPVEHMIQHGSDGMADVLRLLQRQAMRASLA